MVISSPRDTKTLAGVQRVLLSVHCGCIGIASESRMCCPEGTDLICLFFFEFESDDLHLIMSFSFDFSPLVLFSSTLSPSPALLLYLVSLSLRVSFERNA